MRQGHLLKKNFFSTGQGLEAKRKTEGYDDYGKGGKKKAGGSRRGVFGTHLWISFYQMRTQQGKSRERRRLWLDSLLKPVYILEPYAGTEKD